MKTTKKIALFLAAALAACALAGCGRKAATPAYASYDTAYGYDYEEAAVYGEPADYTVLTASGSAGFSRKAANVSENGRAPEASPYGRKIVYNATLSMTVDDPKKALDAVSARCQTLGGYVSASYERVSGSGTVSVTATLKVPADGLGDLLEELKTLGKTESSRLSSDDISASYYDIEARLRAAKAEEEQLLAILEKCASIEEILAVREQLACVRADIESYQASINLWDHQVAYATVELTLAETPKTPAETDDGTVELWKFSDVARRMKKGFANSWRSVLNALGAIGIFLANALLPVAVFGAIAFGAVKLTVTLFKKNAGRRAARREARKAAREAKKKA